MRDFTKHYDAGSLSNDEGFIKNWLNLKFSQPLILICIKNENPAQIITDREDTRPSGKTIKRGGGD